MEVLILQVFVSLVLVVSSIVLFAYSARQRDYEHAEGLSLAPLEDDDGAPAKQTPPIVRASEGTPRT